MIERDIHVPKKEWRRFFKRFSQQHFEWLCELRSPEGIMAKQAPLRSIGIDERTGYLGIRLGNEQAVDIHHVNVDELYRLEAEEAGIAGLRFETRDGSSVFLRFRVPAQPEEVDGLPPSREQQSAR